jgi:hypothetical protein
MWRAIGLSLLLACGAAHAQELVWRKAAPAKATPAVGLGRPGVVRAQAADDFLLPPQYWSSTLGKDDPPKIEVKEAEGTPPPAFPAGNEMKINPWTGQPFGAVWGQFTASAAEVVGDWLIPADELLRPQHRLEVSGEYLLWWTRGSTYPPLVTTDSPNVPQGAFADANAVAGGQGALPPAGTGQLIFGGQQEDPRTHSGARFHGTYWLGDCGAWGIEAGFFFLGEQSDRFAADSDASAVLARPFINALNGQEARQLVATPGAAPGDALALRGAIAIDAPSRLWGWDVALRRCLCSDECWKVDGSLGYRHLSLTEALNITEDIVSARAVPGTTNLDLGNRIRVFDLFQTHNEFDGVQLGLRGEYRWQHLVFEGKARLGLGNVHQRVDIAGAQVISRLTGQVQTLNGGFLALPSNSGPLSQNRFGVVPEVGIKVGYQISDGLRAYVGYDFLFWNSVLRPADQVDRRLNPLLIPGFIIPPQPFTGPALPRVPLQTTSYWAQGVSFGLEYRY